MKQFINEKMNEIFCDFKDSIEGLNCCCSLKNLRYNGGNIPDYSDDMIQQLYLLRYFPAYIVEYYHIYKELIEKNFLDCYNVLSIGAGCSIDYYALYFALNLPQEKFNELVCYTGIDKIAWNYTDSLENENYYLLNKDITDWDKLDWSNYNTIMFPKSIGEFSSSEFERLLEVFKNSSFDQDNICLISSLREQNDGTDISRMQRIVNIFCDEHDYACVDDAGEYTCFNNVGGFINIYPYYKYPEDILQFVRNLVDECKLYETNQCTAYEESCAVSLNKCPILKTDHVKYQVIRLVRN